MGIYIERTTSSDDIPALTSQHRRAHWFFRTTTAPTLSVQTSDKIHLTPLHEPPKVGPHPASVPSPPDHSRAVSTSSQ